MAWSTRHVFAYQEVPTASNLNTNFANLDETMPAKVTTKADMTAATGANAIARVAGGSVRWWAPVTLPSEATGIKFYPLPTQLDYSYTSYSVSNTAVETDTWSKVLDAGMPGAREMLKISFFIMYLNNSGSSRTITSKFYIGTTAYSIATGPVTVSATQYILEIDIMVRALNSLSSQFVFMTVKNAQLTGGGGNYAVGNLTGTGSDDFTSSKTIKFSVTHSAACAALTAVVYHPTIMVYPGMT